MTEAYGKSGTNVTAYLVLVLALVGMAPSASGGTLYSFTPFPYDMTEEAVSKTYDIAEKFGTIYAIQLDNGIPWKEALTGDPWPKEVQETWEELRNHRPPGRKMVISIAPLNEDRLTRAPAAEGSSVPLELQLASFNSSDMKTAYLNYVQRVVDYFDPDYLNIGQEAGELAFHDPKIWLQFTELFHYVRTAIKQSSPNIAVGISFNLQMLLDPKVATRAGPLIQDSDFIGISFYPYMSPEYQRYGLKALPPAPGMWNAPLTWLAKFATKPIAIFETGYSSANVVLKGDGVTLNGNSYNQSRYLQDLAGFAKRNKYLFIVWFMPIDYEKLFTRIKPENEYYKIWQNIGFFDKALQPKPAWAIWQNLVKGQ